MASVMIPLGFVVIPKRSMGSLDSFLPFVVQLRAKGAAVMTVVLNDAIEDMMESSRFHAASFRALTTYERLQAPRFFGRWGQVWKLIRLIAVLVRFKLRCRNLVILAPMSDTEPAERKLLRLLRLFGTTIWFPTSPIGNTPEFAARFSREAWSTLLANGAKTRFHPVQTVGRAACYRESELALVRLRFDPDTKYVVIGTPPLNSEWQRYVRSKAASYVDSEVAGMPSRAQDASIVTIVVPAPEYFWFDDTDGCYQLVDEAIELIGELLGENTIVLIKTKPQHFEKFGRKLKFGNRNVKLTTLGLSVLAAKSRLALGIQETSGIFDFLVMGVPVIEYARYSKEWLKVCPDGSAYRRFPGVTHIEDKDGLCRALEMAKADTLPRAELAELQDFLGDRNQIDAWIEELVGSIKPDPTRCVSTNSR
jgi:hypothetical protein